VTASASEVSGRIIFSRWKALCRTSPRIAVFRPRIQGTIDIQGQFKE
jgi:hypothetical protein